MNAKDRVQGYFLASAIGFAVGVLLTVYAVPTIYIPYFFNIIMIFTIIISTSFLGAYEVHDAIKHQGD